uniref:Uncharacterized protein n=1 Tax=Arundo donax TaxID=35708 RepID=A0A0A9HKN8_ARUDO
MLPLALACTIRDTPRQPTRRRRRRRPCRRRRRRAAASARPWPPRRR